MKVKVNKNRQVFGGSLKVGITNENNYEVLEFTFPQELDNYIKYIEIEAENEEGKLEYVDRIENNKFTLSNRLTKYSELTMEVSCRDLNGIVFKSEIFTVTIGQALNILEDLVQEQEDLFERVERELQEVYQGMEDFKTEIVEDANSRFNTNVTEKTQNFNTNAETKTTDFNNNYDTKLNAFNSNYDEKLGTFNSNATSKLTEYNNNDTAKIGAYNTNATEKLNTYNTNATDKLAEYNTNAEAKLNAYNTNATQKLAEYDSLVEELHEDLDETQAKVEQYNTNIDTKYTQYNTNATEKLDTYNQNATTKTNDYNTNAQTKLEAYNTNATAKTTAYNENAEEKLEEYNENASALIQSVETLEQKHDTEVAELQAEITDLQTDLNMATDLIPTDTATGSDITLNDSARYYFKKIVIEGKSEQETTKIIYICDGTEIGIYYFTYDSIDYQFTMPTVAEGDILVFDTSTLVLSLDSTTITTEAGTSGTQLTFKNTPNPSYKCPIQNITGNVEVKVENKNFLSDDVNGWEQGGISSTTGIEVVNGTRIRTKEYYKVLALTDYYISVEDSNYGFLNIILYNSLKEYITHYASINNSIDGTTGMLVNFPQNTEYIRVVMRKQNNDNITPTEITTIKPMIIKSSTPIAYIPHEEQTVTFPLSEGQILHEGDTIENKIIQRRKTVTISGNSATFNDAKTNGQYLCSQKIAGTLNGKTLTFDTSVENAVVEYELETPIETEFTEAQATAKAQIDKLYSYKGTTYITSEANLNVIYRKDPSLAEEQQNNKLEELEARIALLEE